MRGLAPVAALALLGACSNSTPESDDAYAGSARISEDEATELAADEVAGEGFESVGDASRCTEDCGGHDAGFEWAKEQGITDASECEGKSESFVEGCETYAEAIEERAQEIEEESADDEDSRDDYY